ncbi:MAG TPA: homoserine kinase [Jatrophihabitantaceae bacterium]
MSGVFRGGPVHVRVPATSANLGPGYDTLGLALSWYDDVVARIADDGLVIDIAGEGESVARDETHLVVRAMRSTFDRLGSRPPGLELSCANRIPHGRGLGSSAAAIVSGVALARALVVGGDDRLPDDEAFALAAELEGHPDNVAACWYGGLTVAWTDGGTARAARTEVRADIHPVALVPPFESSTAAARGVLPAVVPHADAAFTGARTALLVSVLSGAGPLDALLAATADRLHQTYRAASMPLTSGLVEDLRAQGLPAVISGAGPTVLVLARDHVEVEQIAAAVPAGWRCEALLVDSAGAHLVPAPRSDGAAEL